MLTQLRIQNFKGWVDTKPIRLAPLTVFFGANSSGKSSIGQFLMMLRQTADSQDLRRVLHPGDKTTPVDLGRFADMLFRRDLSKVLSFSLEWREAKPIQFRDVISEQSFSGQRFAFEADIGAHGKEDERPTCKRFSYALKHPEGEDVLLKTEMGPHPKKQGKYELTCQGFDLVRQPGRPWELPAPIHFYGFPDETSVYYQNATALQEFPFTLQKRLKRMFYLGPLRKHPERQYPWAGDTPEQVGVAGENWVGAILAARSRRISRGMGKYKALNAQPFEQLIARWLKNLGLIHSFTVEHIAKGTRDYRVQVKVSEHSERVSIPDVGFGVSQILPVLVECFYAPPDSTIIIEQPELHLHPSVQQGLADLFIEVIRSREGGHDRRIQLIIESHSEHFLRRLQRRLAEGTVIKQEDVSAYFCAADRESLAMTELDVDAFGNIRNWPTDFFGDQMTDIAEMTKAGNARRRSAQQSTST